MSKATIGGVIGGIIGFYVGGPTGAQLGFMIGSGIGASFDTIQGRKVGEMSSPRAQEGEPIPLVFGTARVTGRLMSCGEPSIVEEGGKGGPQVVNETAYLSYSILVCESSELRDSTIGGILMVIQNNKIVYDVSPNPAISAADSAKWKQNKVFYFGGEGQGVDPTEQMIHGVGNVPAYRGLCRMVVTDEDVTQHGGGIPTYEFVTSQCGVSEVVPAGVARFVGGGVNPDGFKATTRGFDADLAAIGTDDIDVGAIDDTQIQALSVHGSKVYAIIKPTGVALHKMYSASRTDLTAWTFEADFTPGDSTFFRQMESINGSLWLTYGSEGVTKYDGATTFTTTVMPGTGGTVGSLDIGGIAGSGANLFCINSYCTVWRSSDGGNSWSEIADLFWRNSPRRFYTQSAIAHSGSRLVILGSDAGVMGVYSDDHGATWNDCTFSHLPNLSPYELKWIGGDNWMFSCNSADSGVRYVFLSTDNAASFSKITFPEDISAGQQRNGQIAVDAITGRVVVAGLNGSAQSRMFWSDDLSTWNAVDLSDTASRQIWELYPPGASIPYIPPDGAEELPDSPGHYVDPITGEVTGPTTVITDTCPPITLQEIIDKLDARAGIPTANSVTDELADIVVPGYAIDSFMTVAEAKEVLRPIYRFACPEYDDKIRYELFGRDTDFVVDPDDLIVTGEPSEKSVRGQTVEFPRRLHVQYVDPALGYKPMKQTDERTSPDIRVKGELVMGANVTLEADTAKQAAVVGLKVAWTEREDMGKEIALPIDYYADTIPSHTYTLEGRRFRITDMRLSAGAIYLTSVYDRQSAFFSNAVGTVGPRPTAPGSQVRGPTISMVMNAPVLRDVDDKAGIYWGACGPMTGWKGAKLQVSRDGGATWEDGPTVDSPAVMGELTTTLPAASRYAQDNTNTLAVVMYRADAAMDSTDFEGLMEERNVFAIMYPDGTVEIGQFETATEIVERQWELTGLMRGRQDTVAGEHLAGAKFVLLTDNVRFVAIRPDDVGKTLKFRAISVGTDPDAAEVQDVTFTTIESLREWQPYYIVPTPQEDGGYCVSWLGRARLGSSRLPIHSQWFEGYRVEFTIGDLVHTVDTTAQEICVTGAALDETFGSNHGIPTITVRARSRVATNDDDFDSPPGAPTTDPNPSYAATIVGGPSDGYVGEPIFDALGPAYSSPFQAYGGKTEERFTGEIVGNVTCQSSNPGAGVMVGIPLAAETRNAATEMIPTGPDVGPGGPFLITDSVTISAKPTYSMMDESKPLGGKVLVTTVTTPARTTKQLSSIGLGGLKSRAGTSTDKVRCAFIVTDMPVGGRLFVGVLAAGADAHLAPGTGGSYAHLVTADGTYVVELDGATGDIEVFEIGVGSVATGTLPLTYAFDGLYRFAWSANDALNPCPGATVHTNMGNESWPDTPTAGFGGLLNADTIVPCGFDAAVGSADGYWLQGVSSLTEATSGGISAASLVYAYSAFGKSTGKWRIGMRGLSTSRLGFCKTGHTGLLGASGTADSIGFTDTRGPDGFVIDTSFGGVFNRITIPPFFYYAHPLVYFAFDTDAHTLAIYVKVEVISGDPTATYALLTTLTGIPSGTWLPAVNGAAQLVPEIPEPATYNDWTITL